MVPPQCGWGRTAFGSTHEPRSTHNPLAGPPRTASTRGPGRSSRTPAPSQRPGPRPGRGDIYSANQGRVSVNKFPEGFLAGFSGCRGRVRVCLHWLFVFYLISAMYQTTVMQLNCWACQQDIKTSVPVNRLVVRSPLLIVVVWPAAVAKVDDRTRLCSWLVLDYEGEHSLLSFSHLNLFVLCSVSPQQLVCYCTTSALNALCWFSSQTLRLRGCNARARARPASPLSYTGSAMHYFSVHHMPDTVYNTTRAIGSTHGFHTQKSWSSMAAASACSTSAV